MQTKKWIERMIYIKQKKDFKPKCQPLRCGCGATATFGAISGSSCVCPKTPPMVASSEEKKYRRRPLNVSPSWFWVATLQIALFSLQLLCFALCSHSIPAMVCIKVSIVIPFPLVKPAFILNGRIRLFESHRTLQIIRTSHDWLVTRKWASFSTFVAFGHTTEENLTVVHLLRPITYLRKKK